MTSKPEISEASVADDQRTNEASVPTRDPWIARSEDFLQSWHTNIRLKEQLHCVLAEGDKIKEKYWDLQRGVRAMRAELRRINQAEEKNAALEAEIGAAKKKLEEERASAALKEQHLRKLEEDYDRLQRRYRMLAEESLVLTELQKMNQREYLQLSCRASKLRRQLQECQLSSSEKDDFSAEMEHQIRNLQEHIQECEATVQVLEDRQQALKAKLLSFAEKKARDSFRNANCLPPVRKTTFLQRVKRALRYLSCTFQVFFVIIVLAYYVIVYFHLTNERVTDLYHHPVEFMGYYIRPTLQLHFNCTDNRN